MARFAFLLLIITPATLAQTTLPKTPAATTSTSNPSPAAAEPALPPPPTPSRAQVLRGAYGPWRANNDLLYYHLTLRVDPATETIAGSNLVRFNMLADATRIQLDLTPALAIDRITFGAQTLPYLRDSGALFIDFPRTLRRGETIEITVAYHGSPVSRGRFGGFTFARDPAGRPWIYTAVEDGASVQDTGASLFWPCKDQWRDEPQQGMDISIAVPTGLTDISNGRFISAIPLSGDQAGYIQWNYHVSYPINAYDVALNIGAYAHFSDTYTNREHPGSPPLSLDFYALPEDLAQAKAQFPQARAMLDAYEHFLGPYPFVRDGYKLIQVPYAGMEHQSAIAYGNRFHNGYLDRDWTGAGISPRFDFIIIHESGHEWFGNSITAADQSDMWIHEGWTTYLESLFVEFHYGRADALRYLAGLIPKVHNNRPILTERGVAGDPPSDQYFKAALMIATLRSSLAANGIANDPQWFTLLHDFYQHFAYHNILTEDVIAWWNTNTRLDLTPFFNQYLRHTAIPCLELTWLPDTPGATTHTVLYKWRAGEPAFAMPVQVSADQASSPWQTLHPTTAWQSFTTPLAPTEFHVATDLFYINVAINP